MPIKTHPIFSNFSRGEWSPTLEGRVDIQGYPNSLWELTDWILKPQGGMITRGGWHFAGEVKDSTKEVRNIPFQYGELANYNLEFGDYYIRFFTDCGQVMDGASPYEIVSPYSEDDIWGIGYAQDDENLYLTHPDYPPRKLVRNSDIDWELIEENRDNGPYMDEITNVTIDPSAATGEITLLAAPSLSDNIVKNSTFNGSAEWTWGAGWTYYALLKLARHLVDGTAALEQDVGAVATRVYRVKFTLTSRTAGTVTPYIGGVAGTSRNANGTYTEDITATGTGNLQIVPSNDFRGRIDNVYVYEVTSSKEIFLPGHVGSVFRIRHTTTWGRVRINSVTDSLNASGTVLETLGGVGVSSGYMESSWSDVNGYPKIVNFNEGRIQYTSAYEQPQTIWASKIYVFDNFSPGADDNSPYSFTLSNQSYIRWLISARVLCIGCMTGETTAEGPNDEPITSTTPPKMKDQTNHGSAPLSAIKVGRAILFVQKSETKIREFVYQYEDDAYSAPDITILAEHMFGEGIMDMAYQQEPYSILWALTSDGILHGCCYDRINNVVGWFDMETDGEIESISIIPYGNQDQLWAIIRRNINGVYKRYEEYLDFDISVDSGLTYSGVPITNLGGFGHLIGETVAVVGDGAFYGEYLVSGGGTITIDPAASEIIGGLPFTPKVVTNRPEINMAGSSSHGLKKSWKKVILTLINSMGLTVNGQVIPARSVDDIMGSPPDPYSGDFPVENLGWDEYGRITIEQTIPLKSEVVCLTGTLIVGDD